MRFEGAGLDGIIAKAGEQAYVPDKRVMTKIKHVRTADCVLAGYRVHKSGPDAIGSLMLGLYDDDGKLRVRRRRRRVPDGAAARAVRRSCSRWSARSRTTRGTGRASTSRAARGVRQPLEPGQVAVVRAAAARARARGPLRPHGGLALPAPAAVRALAPGSRSGARAATPSSSGRSTSTWRRSSVSRLPRGGDDGVGARPGGAVAARAARASGLRESAALRTMAVAASSTRSGMALGPCMFGQSSEGRR